MARYCKCCICDNNIIDEDDKVPIKSRYAHVKCFNAYTTGITHEKTKQLKKEAEDKKTRKKTPKPEQKDPKQPLSEEEYQYKQGYYQKLRTLLDVDDIPSKIYAITEKTMSKYEYTFKGMLDTLNYLELKEKELKGDVVGIIPFYYDEAKAYYAELERVEKNNQGMNVGGMYKEKVVVIKPKKRVIKQLPFD